MPETLRFNEQTIPCPEGLTLAALLTDQGVNAGQGPACMTWQVIDGAPAGCDKRGLSTEAAAGRSRSSCTASSLPSFSWSL